MAHSEHNRAKKRNSGFVLIIFGALLLFLAPNVHTDNPELGLTSLVFGLIVGGFGFYIHEHLSTFSIETITYFLDLHRFEIEKSVEGDYLFVCARNINEGYTKPYKPKYSFDKNGLKQKAIKHYKKVKNDFLYFFESNDYRSIGIFGVSSQTHALARVLNNQQRKKIRGLFTVWR